MAIVKDQSTSQQNLYDVWHVAIDEEKTVRLYVTLGGKLLE